MKQEIEFRHLRYFLAVAETLHFSKAAAQLGMAQPPLSQQIRSLERMLGYSLFERTTRGVRLTRVGQYFRERARSTLTKIRDDVEMARRLGSGQEGANRGKQTRGGNGFSSKLTPDTHRLARTGRE